jgi:hypothetical protein
MQRAGRRLLKRGRPSRKSRTYNSQCISLPIERNQLTTSVDVVWLRKKTAIDDRIKSLRKIRTDLESDTKWTLGEPGSIRQQAIYFAEVTKSTTDLIENLAGFSSGNRVGCVQAAWPESLWRLQVNCFKACVTPKGLRRLAKGPQKSPAHVVPVAESRLARHDVDRVAG